ncbi:MAG TPA: HAMP domain-containing sensor histidine kinase [Polyangia bacterium]|nr:HAMP domain-containing sensor histidine kinase [Polyangia bacterium]
MGAFAVVIVAFVTATVYSESRTSVLNEAALSIAANAAPSIEHLAASRGGLRQLLLTEDDYVDAIREGQPISPEAMLGARALLQEELNSYRGLPQYPGEAQAWDEAQRQLNELDHTLADVLAAEKQSQEALRAADLRFRAQVMDLGKALSRSLQINADMAQRLARTIEDVSIRRHRLVFGLDVICAVATVGAALLLLRLLRRHQRLARAYEQALERRADEMEAFAGRVAHDVRNAMAPVSLSVSHLVTLDLGEQAHRWVTIADRGVWRLYDLVEGLLAFAQAGAQPVPGERADVAQVVEDVVSALRASADDAGCELRVGALTSCQVSCNVGVLTSMVANLIGNAVKHMGDVSLRLIEASAVERGSMVRVTIVDSGPGVPSDLRDQIFQPFVKGHREAPGAGLGLATVKRLAEGHGGAAGMYPAPTGGSAFWFELPAFRGEGPRAEIGVTPPFPPRGAGRARGPDPTLPSPRSGEGQRV